MRHRSLSRNADLHGHGTAWIVVPASRGAIFPCCWFVLGCAACTDGGPASLTLNDLQTPDSNTAIVVFRDPFLDGDIPIPAGEEQVYVLDAGRIPHVTLGRHAFGSDSAEVQFVVSDLYATGIVPTDGMTNRFSWRSPAGNEYTPATPCELRISSAYVLGQPSTQVIETACRVEADGHGSYSILAKARRFLPLGGASSGQPVVESNIVDALPSSDGHATVKQ